MRLSEFRTLTEQQLDELKMSPSSLNSFAQSDAAKGIMAGFEAELVFTGLGGESEYDQDPEPDYDADERCRSISQVIEFFENDEYGYGIYGRERDRLQDDLDEKYMEWSDEQMYRQWQDERDDLIRDAWLAERPMTERIHDALTTGMEELSDDKADAVIELHARRERGEIKGSEMSETELEMMSQYSEASGIADDVLAEDVEQTIEKEDGFYDEILDNFRSDFYIDDDSGFFTDVGLRYMSDVASEYSLMWPVITYTGSSNEGGFSEENAERLADDLHEKLGVKTKVSGGYHSARRDSETWIFEPDSSLDADDSDNMPVEIVSPPMPLEECLKKMEQFFEWAESNGAYANSSTGFHMGVSLPYRGGDVDYVKLALFLGDEHVLKQFGRSGNHFCEAAMKKIRQRVAGKDEAVSGAMELMRKNLLELAQKALEVNNHGFGKYTSINPQGGNDSTRPHLERGAKYIEFRSAGGTNYFEDIDRLKNTLLRYAQAMVVAGDPAAYRNEYAKKLYKLIAPQGGDNALELFARYNSGTITQTELKQQWAEKALRKDAPHLVGKSRWKLYNRHNGVAVPGHEYNGYTRDEARKMAKQKISPASSDKDFDQTYELRDIETVTGRWRVIEKGTGRTLDILDADTRGAAADFAYDTFGGEPGFFIEPYDGDEKPALSRRAEIAKRIKDKANNKELDPTDPANVKREWEFVDRMDNNRVLGTLSDATMDQAERMRLEWVRRSGMRDEYVGKRSVPTTASADRARARIGDPVPAGSVGTTDIPEVPIDIEQNFTGTWRVLNANTGEEVYRFGGSTNTNQGDANRVAAQWVRQSGYDDPVEVVPELR
jgi:hypothetical protein